MEKRLVAALTFASAHERLPRGWVSTLCREIGISRDTFYRYRRRFETEGPAGLMPRSRRPHRSPEQTSAAVEEEIVRLRKDLVVDNGALSIHYHLSRRAQPGDVVPSAATIHRILVRRGMVVPAPEKRPKSSFRRFTYPDPNGCWQMDGTGWVLADGTGVCILDVIDDHSRVAVAGRVGPAETGELAWSAFCDGTTDWGLPARLLSDNGSAFTGRFINGGETQLELDLRALGVDQIHSRPSHPRTCGKVERYHQTQKRWLATRPPAATMDDLQAQVDEFRNHYNTDRPHRALAGRTPAEAWAARPTARPGPPIGALPRASRHTVDDRNRIKWRGFWIGLGPGHRGHTVLVVARDLDLAIFDHAHLIRRLTIDPARKWQPSGNPPGRPRRRP